MPQKPDPTVPVRESVPRPCAQPELADASRALLRTVGLAEHWRDDGPDPAAAAWLAAGDGAATRPAELTPDQWTMLLVCQALWSGEGGPSMLDLVRLSPRAFCLLSSYLQARNIGAEDMWSEAHCA